MRQWGRPPSANGPTGRRMKPWRGGVADREIGQHLPVDLDPALFEAGDEPAVAQAVDPGRRVDPGDPERPELRLLLPPVAVGVPHSALDVFLGRLVQLAP